MKIVRCVFLTVVLAVMMVFGAVAPALAAELPTPYDDSYELCDDHSGCDNVAPADGEECSRGRYLHIDESA